MKKNVFLKIKKIGPDLLAETIKTGRKNRSESLILSDLIGSQPKTDVKPFGCLAPIGPLKSVSKSLYFWARNK